MRNYSISSKPNEEYLRISVKSEDEGYVSNFLHNNILENDILEISPPCGVFHLKEERIKNKSAKSIVLLAGGIGITPLMSMMLYGLDAYKDLPIILVY